VTEIALSAPAATRATALPGGRIASLDGLRGAAALMVVIAHYFGEAPGGIAGFTWGWVGVGLFFVLSGFLIGGIILDQKEERSFLRNFYLKRAGRILPAYLIALTLAFGGAWLFRAEPWVDPLRSPLIYLTFTQNIAIPLSGEAGSAWLLPTWTLAVEEQFYLLLPLLLMALSRRALAPILVILWAAATAFRFAVHDANHFASLTLLPSRMDLLLAGVLAALALRGLDLSRWRLALRLTPLAAVIGLLAVALTRDPALFAILSPTLLSLGAGAFILALVQGAPEGKRFSGPVLGFFGLISYGLYLLHQPISGLLHGLLLDDRPNVASPEAIAVSVLAVAVSVGAAYASFRLVEAPVLAVARRAASRKMALH